MHLLDEATGNASAIEVVNDHGPAHDIGTRQAGRDRDVAHITGTRSRVVPGEMEKFEEFWLDTLNSAFEESADVIHSDLWELLSSEDITNDLWEGGALFAYDE